MPRVLLHYFGQSIEIRAFPTLTFIDNGRLHKESEITGTTALDLTPANESSSNKIGIEEIFENVRPYFVLLAPNIVFLPHCNRSEAAVAGGRYEYLRVQFPQSCLNGKRTVRGGSVSMHTLEQIRIYPF